MKRNIITGLIILCYAYALKHIFPYYIKITLEINILLVHGIHGAYRVDGLVYILFPLSMCFYNILNLLSPPNYCSPTSVRYSLQQRLLICDVAT